jgi:hypothetical protein
VEGDLVEAAPARIEELQLRRVAVRVAARLAHRLCPPCRAEVGERRGVGAHGVGAQRRVLGPEVTVAGWWRLVRDVVRGEVGSGGGTGHRGSPQAG